MTHFRTSILIAATVCLFAFSYGQKPCPQSPRVLSYSESSRYLKHLRTLPLIVQRKFGWMYYESNDVPEVLTDSTNFQVYEFPNHVTTVGFARNVYSGLVAYRTGTDSILAAFSWTDEFLRYFPDEFKGHFDVGTTYYHFYPVKDHWELVILVVALMPEGDRPAHFYLDMQQLIFGSDMSTFSRPMRH